MTITLKEIQRQAISLPAEERAQLAESMLESLHSSVLEIQDAWNQEIENRVAAFDRGEMPVYAAEDVLAEARRLTR